VPADDYGSVFIRISGRLDWSNAWVLLGLSLATGLAFIAGRDPELAAERRNVKAGKNWDKALVGITVLLGPMAVWITAGLDNRFQWSKGRSSLAFTTGLVAAVLAAALIAWAMRSNRFFSSVVQIQKDRGHSVVDSGPYRFIRHPGYAGTSMFTLMTPFDSRFLLGARTGCGDGVRNRAANDDGGPKPAQGVGRLCRLRL